MISIKINNEYLDLYPDTKIRMSLHSGLFDNETIEGSGSFPFDLPFTPKNNRLFGYPDVIENSTVFGKKIEDVEIHFNHVRIYSGFLRITNVSTSIRADFSIGLSKIADAVQNKSMQDMVDETISLSTTTTKAVVVAFDDTYYMVGTGLPITYSYTARVTINGTNYDGDFSDLGLRVIASSINATALDVRARFAKADIKNKDAQSYFSFKRNAEFESLAAHLVVEDYNGSYTFAATLIKKSDSSTNAATLQEYSYSAPDIETYRAQDYTKKIAFPLHECSDFYGDNNGFCGFCNDVNSDDETDINNAAQIIEEDQEDSNIWANSLLPFVYNKYFLTKVESTLGITISGDPLANLTIARTHICAMKSLDNFEAITYKTYGGADTGDTCRINSHIKSFDLGSYLPNVSFGTWLKSFRNLFGLYFFYDDDNDELFFYWLNDLVSATTYDEWTDRATDSIDLGPNEYEGLLFPQNTEGITDYVEDDGVMNIYNVSTLMPQNQCDQEGESPALGTSSIKKLFLTYYLYGDYPEHSDTLLTWSGASGLITNYWEEIIDFLKATRAVKIKMQLSLTDLLALQEIGSDDVPNIARKKRIHENNFLIKTVDVQLTMDGIEPADVELHLAN